MERERGRGRKTQTDKQICRQVEERSRHYRKRAEIKTDSFREQHSDGERSVLLTG